MGEADRHEGDRLGVEKRRYVRLEIELKVRFRIEDDPEGRVFEALTGDISHGGVRLVIAERTAELLALFEHHVPRLAISLQLTDPDCTVVEAQMSTAWLDTRIDWMVRPAERGKPILMGMAFERLDAVVSDRIDSFIADQLIARYRSR